MPHLFCVLLNFLVVVTHKNAPSTMLRMVPLPRCGRGGWGSHIPSPCGDVVLKWLVERKGMIYPGEFPSPCGDVVLKYASKPDFDRDLEEFPSPCGDMLYSPPPSDGGGGERCEPVGALTADVPFSRWRCADRSRRPFHHASHGPPPPLRQGRLGFAFPSPCGDVVLK